LVEVGNRVGLVANEIIESIGGVGIDKAIANPFSRTDGFLDVRYNFKGGFYAVFVGKACVEAFEVGFAAEAEDVGAVGTCKCNQFA
jgi:hypothetical protein